MANPEQFAILQKGTDAWNAWRRNADQATTIDLSGANLQDATLHWPKPGGSVGLSYADLSFADLSQANVYGADLTGANLSYANLGSADLDGANLSFANLKGANLKGANLSMTLLTGADFADADLGYTLFAFCDLRNVRGLESVVHSGPSSIGIETIYKSVGEIPEVFLRGSGVPDAFIKYAKSLVGSAIEFYSCFISYSTKDQEFADRLYADLQAKGVRCWFAPHDVQAGRKLHEQIDEAIRLHDKLLLILSLHSMSSEWVKTEISKARQREVRDKARVLFPISLAPFEAIREWEAFDAKTGKDSASEILEYFIPDFSNWKDHDSYQKAFERLVKDLQSPSEKSSKTSSGA